MTSHSTTPCQPQAEMETSGRLFDNQFEPIEAGLRDRVRELLEALLEAELDEMLARARYARRATPASNDSEVATAAVTAISLAERSQQRAPPVAVAMSGDGSRRHLRIVARRRRSLLGTFGQGDGGAARPAGHARRQDHRV